MLYKFFFLNGYSFNIINNLCFLRYNHGRKLNDTKNKINFKVFYNYYYFC